MGGFTIWILSTFHMTRQHPSSLFSDCFFFFSIFFRLFMSLKSCQSKMCIIVTKGQNNHYNSKAERINEKTKSNAVSKANGWCVLTDSPVAKSANHELANEAPWIAPCSAAPEPEPDTDPTTPVAVPATTGAESLDDFKLHEWRNLG